MSCCPPGSLPALQVEYSPRGQVVDVSGTEVYISRPAGAVSTALILIPDIWGINGGRHKAVCDTMADRGFLAVSAEPFGDDAWKANDVGEGFVDWAKKYPYEKVEDSVLKAFQTAKAEGATRFTAMGFCWGCWCMFHAIASPKFAEFNIASAVSFHPSCQLEGFFGGTPEGLTATVKVAKMHVMPAGNDPEMYLEDGAITKALQANGVDVTVTPFPDMIHGWVPRGDLDDDKVHRDVKKALDLAEATLKE